MNQQPKTTEKPKNKSKIQIRDLKPKKDLKGGTLGDPCEGGQLRKH
jgi:hypothetical protein